jgi:serine/threonine-protein kinase
MSPQKSIAHFRIVSKLGEGGMGVVYRATDTKLNRDVAIKVLPDSFAADPDRLTRFTREAQVLASLNHPNIAAIYGLEERALVLELVDGPTLAERIAAGPIPVDAALPIARQIAEALEYAHEKGIIHRDLKPANVKITPEGRVKVLDFGLAKAMASEASGTGQPEASPTLTMRATVAGVILGTAAYMSPEQARGQEADKRADIWSFGVVVYEMLTGRAVFTGATVSDTLASVLKIDPDWSALPADTPLTVRRLLRRCLERDRKRRLRDIGDSQADLEDALAQGPSEVPLRVARAGSQLPWVLVGLTALAGVVLAVALSRATRPQALPMVRLSADLGPAAIRSAPAAAILSPDGTRVVFSAKSLSGGQQLATRLLDQPNATLLAGTNGASAPFFSPDGQFIGFFAGGKLKKISIQGGAVVSLCDARPPQSSGSWGEDGYIIFTAASTGLLRVADVGGAPQLITNPNVTGYVSHRFPQVLNGGKDVLFTATSSSDIESADLQVFSIAAARTKTLVPRGYFGRYVPSGHLLYVHENVLFSVPFDPARLEVTGTPVALLEDVAAVAATGAGQFDFSRSGTLVYSSGHAITGWTIESLDNAGHVQQLVGTPARYSAMSFSPDGGRLAIAQLAGGESLWIYDRRRGSMSKLTAAGPANFPVWAPDGRHLAYMASRSGHYVLSWIRADGAGEPQTLFDSQLGVWPTSFSPDGRLLAFHRRRTNTGMDVVTLPLDLTDPEHPRPGTAATLISTGFVNVEASFSPDGHWIAYQTSESGTQEVYVRPFPSGGQRSQISTGGGTRPIWSAQRRELFFQTPDNFIMAAEYKQNGDSLSFERPHRQFGTPIFSPGAGRIFDVAPDGQHFAVFGAPEMPPEQNTSVHVTFLFNFFDELRRRTPVGGK